MTIKMLWQMSWWGRFKGILKASQNVMSVFVLQESMQRQMFVIEDIRISRKNSVEKMTQLKTSYLSHILQFLRNKNQPSIK